MNPPVKHLAVLQLLFRYPFSNQGDLFGLNKVLKDQEPELNTEGGLSIIGLADSHFSRKHPIGPFEDLDVVTVQVGIVRSEGSSTDVLGGKSTKGFPQLGVKLKVLD
jgi:hypothetical protein